MNRFVPMFSIVLVTIGTLPLTANAFSFGGVSVDPNPFHPSVSVGSTTVPVGPAISPPSGGHPGSVKIPVPGGGSVSVPVPTGDPVKDSKKAAETAGQVLAPVAKGIDNGVHDLTHGIDHFFKEIDHLAKKHGKELGIKGRITTCTQTMCLSEVYRDYELKKARAEAQAQKEEMLRNARAQMEKDEKENNLDSLKKSSQSLSEQLARAKEMNDEYDADIKMFQSFLGNLVAEAQNRASLRKMGRPLPVPAANVVDLVQQMSTLLNAPPDSEAMAQLGDQIAARAQQLGIDVVAMNDEIMKSISDADLQNMMSKVDQDLKTKVELQAALTVNTAELQSQLDITNAAVKKHEASGK